MPTSVTSWLLEKDQPAVRYRTLLDLLDQRDDDSAVKDARGAIGERGWAARILALQKPGGYWEAADNLYRPKYVATIWRFIVLADLGLTAKDSRMRRTCRLYLDTCARPDGGFGRTSSHFCSSANITRSLIRCGYEDDPRVRSALDWLVRQQKEDGGWHCFPSHYGTLDCWEALATYASFPRKKWSRSIRRSAERGAEFFLSRRLFRQGKRYEPWFRFHYPVHYYYDILVGLDVLTSLGYGEDERLEPALEILLSKRRKDGRWNLDAVHPDVAPDDPYKLVPPWEPEVPTPFGLERPGSPSKWITLTAFRVLKRTGHLSRHK